MWEKIADACLMPGCAACGVVARTVEKRNWGVRLCSTCAAAWPNLLGWAPLQDGMARWGLWPYAGTVRRLIVQAKDMPHGAQAWALRRAAVEAWREMRSVNAEGPLVRDMPLGCWCATPPSRKRRRADWYLPQFVGPGMAKVEGARFRPLLRRRRQRSDQADLNGAERRANLQGMFQGKWRRGPWPAEVCLFDDVSTTGATFLEARRALLEQGVERVRSVCLAVVV